MHIPAYQIYNVLNAFTSQLCRRRPGEHEKEGKRQATMDKVVADIVTRIGRFGIAETARDFKTDGIPNQRRECNETLFMFNVIDIDSRKTTHHLSAKDPRFIIEQLEQLGRNR